LAQQDCKEGDQRCSAIGAMTLTTASDVKMVAGLVQSFVFVESVKKQGKRYRKSIMVTDNEATRPTVAFAASSSHVSMFAHQDMDVKVKEFCELHKIEVKKHVVGSSGRVRSRCSWAAGNPLRKFEGKHAAQTSCAAAGTDPNPNHCGGSGQHSMPCLSLHISLHALERR